MRDSQGLSEGDVKSVNVGYDLGVIPPNVFTMLVLMAIVSTIVTAPLLRIWLPKMGHPVPGRAKRQ